MDVDIVHNQSSENIAKLLAFLKSIDAFHRRPDDKMIGPKEEDISGMGRVLFTTRLGPLDVLAVIEEGRAYEDLLEHTVQLLGTLLTTLTYHSMSFTPKSKENR